MADLNRLAILANELGGLDEVANELHIDLSLLEKAIQGESLTGRENAEIESGINNLYLQPYLAERLDIDLDELEDLTGELETANGYIANTDLENQFREIIAEGSFDLDYLEHKGIFANLNEKYTQGILQWIAEGNDASEIFDNYENDADFWELEDSAFWAWYRETFYK